MPWVRENGIEDEQHRYAQGEALGGHLQPVHSKMTTKRQLMQDA